MSTVNCRIASSLLYYTWRRTLFASDGCAGVSAPGGSGQLVVGS
jgi:hypothetical protein